MGLMNLMFEMKWIVCRIQFLFIVLFWWFCFV